MKLDVMTHESAPDRSPGAGRALMSRRDGLKLGTASAFTLLTPTSVLAALQQEKSMPLAASQDTGGSTAIRSFNASFPPADYDDLRRRIAGTKWPDREQVSDASQGVQLATTQALARHWASEYDFGRLEAKLKAFPQFLTQIDGLDIHFIHVRSRQENALPMIVTHGWPGSIVEQLKIIDPLTNPTAHGGTANDAFHLVIPSLPGYGFSGKPTAPGWNPVSIARAWATLMQRLGYTRCGAGRRLGERGVRGDGAATAAGSSRH